MLLLEPASQFARSRRAARRDCVHAHVTCPGLCNMNTDVVLEQTFEKGAMCAAAGLTAGFVWVCGSELLRAWRFKKIRLPESMQHDSELKRLLYALVTPRSDMNALNDAIAQCGRAMTLPPSTPLAIWRIVMEGMRSAFKAYFMASGVPLFVPTPTTPVQMLAAAPAPLALRKPYLALLVRVYGVAAARAS